jgi:hypothetical protein
MAASRAGLVARRIERPATMPPLSPTRCLARVLPLDAFGAESNLRDTEASGKVSTGSFNLRHTGRLLSTVTHEDTLQSLVSLGQQALRFTSLVDELPRVP